MQQEKITHVKVFESTKDQLIELAERLELSSIAQAIVYLLNAEDMQTLVKIPQEEQKMLDQKAKEWKTNRSKALSMMIQKGYQQDNIQSDNLNVKLDHLIEHIRSLEDQIKEMKKEG